MIHLQRPLPQHPAVQLGEIVVGLARLSGGGRQQHLGDALQVLQSRGGRLDRVRIADRFGQLARIGAGRIGGREAEPRRLVLFVRPLVERGFLVVGGLDAGDRRIAPLDAQMSYGPMPGTRSSTGILSSGCAT